MLEVAFQLDSHTCTIAEKWKSSYHIVSGMKRRGFPETLKCLLPS